MQYISVILALLDPRLYTQDCDSVCAGVIPFIALSPPVAASLPLIPADLLQNAALLQVAYGASIASFLGGIHWAMAMAEYGGGYHQVFILLLPCDTPSFLGVRFIPAAYLTPLMPQGCVVNSQRV